MNFDLTQEQQQIQKLARTFAENELAPGVLERDANSEFPLEAFQKFGKMGMLLLKS